MLQKKINEYLILELRGEELNAKKTITLMDATFAVAKRKPGRKKKNAAPVPQRSGVPYKPEFFSGFLFSTVKVVSITAIVFFAFR